MNPVYLNTRLWVGPKWDWAGLRTPAKPEWKKRGGGQGHQHWNRLLGCVGVAPLAEERRSPVGDPDICQLSRTYRIADLVNALSDS